MKYWPFLSFKTSIINAFCCKLDNIQLKIEKFNFCLQNLNFVQTWKKPHLALLTLPLYWNYFSDSYLTTLYKQMFDEVIDILFVELAR